MRTHPATAPMAPAYAPSGSFTPGLPPPPDYGYGSPIAGPSNPRSAGGLPGFPQMPSPFLPSGAFVPPPFYGMPPHAAPWGAPLPQFSAPTASPKRRRSATPPPIDSPKRLNMSGQFLTNPSDARVRRLSPPPHPAGFSMPSRVADRPDIVALNLVSEPSARFYYTTSAAALPIALTAQILLALQRSATVAGAGADVRGGEGRVATAAGGSVRDRRACDGRCGCGGLDPRRGAGARSSRPAADRAHATRNAVSGRLARRVGAGRLHGRASTRRSRRGDRLRSRLAHGLRQADGPNAARTSGRGRSAAEGPHLPHDCRLLACVRRDALERADTAASPSSAASRRS